MNIGSWLSTSPSHNDSPILRRSLEISATGSPLVQRVHSPMFGRMTQQSPIPDLKSELSPLKETTQKIGIRLLKMPEPDDWIKSQATYWYVATATSKELLLTIFNQLESSASVWSFGDEQVPVNLVEPGKKEVWMLTRKILAPSFGMDILVKTMLSLMNSEGELISVTCYDGWTDIQWLWKSRDQQQSLRRLLFG